MARPLFDAHCHLQLRSQPPAAVVERARRRGVQGAAVCGCHASDWEKVQMMSRDFPDFVVPSFGIHPWWAGAAVGDGDGRELRELLEQIPTAGVGECGLDGGKKKEIPMELQMEVLRPQLDLALEYQRPVSLHCVAAHGTLLQVLQEVFGRGHGPGLVLHSYCGSVDMVQAFAKLNCYFSFSASIIHIPKHAAALRAVPDAIRRSVAETRR